MMGVTSVFIFIVAFMLHTKFLHPIEERLGNLVPVFGNIKDEGTSLLVKLLLSVRGRNKNNFKIEGNLHSETVLCNGK